MTREEAIDALKLMEHVESIVATYEPGEARNDTTVHELKEACRMAVAALRAWQNPVKLDRSRWEGCERCTSGLPEKGFPHEFWVDAEAIYYPDTEFGWEGELVSYCPHCGRPLTEEAWAELERRIGDNDETD